MLYMAPGRGDDMGVYGIEHGVMGALREACRP